MSERIQRIIDDNRLNYSKLAKIAGVTPQTINLLANGGITDPKVSTIINIANELEINLNWLLTGEGQMKREGNNGTDDMSDFLSQVIQEKDQLIFEMRKTLFEKEKLISQLKGRVGKRRGVSGQPVLALAA